MGQIFLVRHGQASFGAAHYDQLSALGAEQGALLGAWFAARRQQVDQVVTGSLQRHRQTAEAWAARAQAPAEWQIDAGFNEFDHEQVIHRLRPEFADKAVLDQALRANANPRRMFQTLFLDAMARWMSGRHDDDYAESWAQFRQRCVHAVTRLAAGSGDIVVFTSGGPIAAIAQHLLDLPDARAAELNWSLVNSAVTKLLYQPGRISLSYLNNFAHLEQAAQPELITYR